jgi:hypothetical protein
MEEANRFDQNKLKNLKKLEDLQKQIKSANQRKEDEDGAEEEDDDYEDYFSH